MTASELTRGKPVSELRINQFLSQTYLVMALGLVVTGFVASLTANNLDLVLRINLNPWIAFGLFLLQILVVVSIGGMAMRLSALASFLLFIFYSALTGLTLSSIFLIYTQEQIAVVFWLTAGTFFVTSLFGFLTKRDLSNSGSVLMMLLTGWMFTWVLSWIFPLSNFNWLVSYIGIAIFVGLTAHDAQRLKQLGQQVDDHPARNGLVVIGALTLYLNFINIFLLMLRASSRRR
jgi:FtsH-binding integral membrane protein